MRGSLVQNNTARRGAVVHLETCEKRTRTLCAHNGVSSLLPSYFPPDCESWETSGTFPSNNSGSPTFCAVHRCGSRALDREGNRSALVRLG